MKLTPEIEKRLGEAVGRYLQTEDVESLEPAAPADGVTSVFFRMIPLIVERTDQAYAEAILEWGRSQGYDLRLIDAEKVRDAFGYLVPAPVRRLNSAVFSDSIRDHERIQSGTVAFCPSCRKTLTDGWPFCPHCGQKLGWQTDPSYLE